MNRSIKTSLHFVIAILLLGFAPRTLSGMKIIKKGDTVGVFYVTKVAGAVADGVQPGQRLCYRCRFGTKPMVMVFARKTGKRLTDLVSYIDRSVAENRSAKLKGLVTLLGSDKDDLKEAAKVILNNAKVEEIPVAIATEQGVRANQYQLPENADITIVVAKDSRVVHTLVFDIDQIDLASIAGTIDQIIK